MNRSTTVLTNEASKLEEEEPPGTKQVKSDEEEPPGSTATANRNKFFAHVPEESWKDWRWQFRNRITTIEELARYLPLSLKEQAQLRLVTANYPLSVTPHYLSLINVDDLNDPIRKQAIPSFHEVALAGSGTEDPLGEEKDSPVPGLVHRYPDRVLIVLTNLCPVLCRHCTRKREWRHGGWVRTSNEIEVMVDYIRRNTTIRDVIISGGDPLTLSTRHLEQVVSSLRLVGHVEIIRIGTRFPVVLPQRIDDELCAMLSKYGPIWLNTQFNHAREVTPESARACDRLLRAGVPVNNQAVLLRGVNDTIEAQTKLCHELLKIKVRPYYLFECDEVKGTEHLRTPVETGIRIIEGMRGHTSGLAVPTFVIDLPNGGGKVPLQPNYVLWQTEQELILRNYEFHLFHYRNPCRRRNHDSNGRHASDATGSHSVQMAKATLPLGASDENRALIRS